MSIIPVKYQVSFNNDTEFKDFTDNDEAVEFMSKHDDSTLCVLNDQGQELEVHNTHWSIVDTEPLDDGYDYDRYY